MILNGAKLIATNLDPNCPTQSGTRPGCGAIVAMLETATGLKAFSVGKPSPVMMRGAREQLGLTAGQTIVIGDTMDTDILGGVQLGYKTVLVLSGSTRRDDLTRVAFRPDKVVESIADLDNGTLVSELFENGVQELADNSTSSPTRRASEKFQREYGVTSMAVDLAHPAS